MRPLFSNQQGAFISLLRELTVEDWSRPTVCPGWTVHDVATHVLADHVGRLSIHRVNDEWATAARRISPSLLIDLLSTTGEQVIDFWNSIDLDAPGWIVSWAGPDPAPAWLDAARDFTEYWTHHQQISEANRRPGFARTEFLAPVLDTFMRALPHPLRAADTPEDTAVEVTITGPAGGTWTCVRTPGQWALRTHLHLQPAVAVRLDADTAWRLCTRGITPHRRGHARSSVAIKAWPTWFSTSCPSSTEPTCRPRPNGYGVV